MTRPQAEVLQIDQPAVVIIDMQNDFCSAGGAWSSMKDRPLREVRRVIRPIRELIDAAREVGAPIVFTRLTYDPRLPPVEARHGIKSMYWFDRGPRLRPGEWGWEVIDDLAPARDDFFIDKHGYSAFVGTSLEPLMRALRTRTLVICGITTHACVLSTAFSAFDRDYDVIVAGDAVASWFPHLHEAAIEMFARMFGRVVTVKEISHALGAAVPLGPGRI